MLTDSLYPWLENAWQQLQSLKQQSRLPHAIMVRAVDGLGIEKLAQALGTSLLCKNPTEQGFNCGHCSDCHLLNAGTHPDYHPISPPEDKKQIKVDQIRELVTVCMERPHQGGYRVVIIDPCGAMNKASANALLKTLEEPGNNTLIILVANTTTSLPATIRSRCQLLTINSPSEEQGINWLSSQHPDDPQILLMALRLSSHAPLKAIHLLTSEQLIVRNKLIAGMARAAEGQLEPINLVSKIGKEDIRNAIDWMFSLALDTQKLINRVANDKLVNTDQMNLLTMLSKHKGIKLNNWIETLIEARRLLSTTSNINPQLITEDLMFRWIAIFK